MQIAHFSIIPKIQDVLCISSSSFFIPEDSKVWVDHGLFNQLPGWAIRNKAAMNRHAQDFQST